MSTPFWAPDALRTLRQADGLMSCAVLSWFEALCDQAGPTQATPLDRLIRDSLSGAGAAVGTATGPGRPVPRGPAPMAAARGWPAEPSHDGLRQAGVAPGATVQPGLPLAQWQPAQRLAPASTQANRRVNATRPPAGNVIDLAANAAPGPAATPAAQGLPSRRAGGTLQPVPASHATAPTQALGWASPPGVARPAHDRGSGTGTVASLLDRPDRRDRLQDRLAVARPGFLPPDRPAAAGARSDPSVSPALPSWPLAAPTVASRCLPGAQRRDADGTVFAPGRDGSPIDRDADAATGLGARVQPAGSGADHSPATRLVTGLPALQGLLSATLADSRQRHAAAAPPGTLLQGPGVATHPAPTATGSARADRSFAPPAASGDRSLAAAQSLLSGLDALGEEMLVDHLADRLAERLRDQTLRQHGFTGGWL